MRIEKWINIDQAVEIDLSSEDIQLIFSGDRDATTAIMSGINSIACFMKGIPDEKISEMPPKTKEVIFNFLLEQAGRYRLTKAEIEICEFRATE